MNATAANHCGARGVWASTRSLALAICVLLAGVGFPAARAEPQAAPAPASAPADDPLAANRLAVRRANELAGAGDFAGALKVVEETVTRLGPKDPFPDELRGTVLARKKDYASAEASFRAMIEKAPESKVGRFNLAEVIFVTGRYGEAEKGFGALETECTGGDPAVADFCRFMRVVCLLAAGEAAHAQALVPDGEGLIVSPFSRYARAALHYASKDWDGAAKEIDAARKDFSPSIESTFVDAFIELGWGDRTSSGPFAFNRGIK
jgi:tetratricopeptide (TPR) repeat protein